MSIATRLEDLEARESVTAIIVTSDPNGVVESVASTFAVDVTNKKLYLCYGGTDWQEINTI